MLDLNDLRLFALVVDHGGFSAAARAMGLPRSNVSRRIAALEDTLGTRLVQRTTRSFVVTEVGRSFHAHCTAMLVEAEAAAEVIALSQAAPRGLVRVACPASLIQFQVGDMVARFMAACAQVEVELDSTPRRVDVIREGYDLAIRVRFPPLDDSGLIVRKLAASRQKLVAAPELLARLGVPQSPADLTALPSLGWGAGSAEWHLIGPKGEAATLPHHPRFATDDMGALRKAALGGIGICQFPDMVVSDDLASGSLTEVLPGWTMPAGIIHAAFPSRRGLLPSVRALLDHLAMEYAAIERRKP